MSGTKLSKTPQVKFMKVSNGQIVQASSSIDNYDNENSVKKSIIISNEKVRIVGDGTPIKSAQKSR